MKRKILKIYIDSWNNIEEYKKRNFYQFEQKVPISGSIQNLDLKFKTDIKMPDIPLIKDELEILKKEITDVVLKKEEAENFLKNECKCNHEVVISNVDTGTHFDDTCVLCGKNYLGHDNNYSIHTIARKNKKYIVFEGKCIESEGGFLADYRYVTYHSLKEIREIITNIVNNNTNEEIDIVEEIRNLNIDHTIINEPQNKTLILMIVGSNKFYVNDHNYISSNYFKDFGNIIRYFNDMYNTVINVIGSDHILSRLGTIPNKLLKWECKDLSDISNALNYNKDIPYNLIINLSNFYTYEVVDNRIVPTKYNLDLEKKFTDIPIFDINEVNISELDIPIDNTICEKAKSLIKVKNIYE